MLPLNFLKNAKRSVVLAELKNGDSAHGILSSIDSFMNIKLKEVTYIEKCGASFYKTPEIFIRGSCINTIQFKDDVIEKIKEVQILEKAQQSQSYKGVQNNHTKMGGAQHKDYPQRHYQKDKQKEGFSRPQNKDEHSHKRVDSSTSSRGGIIRNSRGGKQIN